MFLFQMAFIPFFYKQSFPEYWFTEARSESTDPIESGSITILTGDSAENRVRTIRVAITKTRYLWVQGFLVDLYMLFLIMPSFIGIFQVFPVSF
jgi:hypothetical protein